MFRDHSSPQADPFPFWAAPSTGTQENSAGPFPPGVCGADGSAFYTGTQ